MIIRGKNILIVSPEPWNHIFVSKHHYAIHLASRDNQVFFLNPPTDNASITRTKYANLYSVNYTGFPRGIRFYPSFVRRFLFDRNYQRLKSLCNVEFDMVWSFDNSVFFDFTALSSAVFKICHIVDLNQDFQTEKAASTADCCFCTTDFIRERLSKYSSRVYKINHGFNATFQEPATTAPVLGGRVKVMYAGNLSMPYIDWNLLDAVTAENPNVDFYFIGPEGAHYPQAKKQVLARPNAHLLGRIDAARLQAYYAQADILLIAYKEEYHKDQANPHKMMEYLGAGKMIVSTYSHEYAGIARDLFYMPRRNKDFAGRFQQSLDELDYWNSAEKQALRRSFAMENTYEMQIRRIEDLIANL